MFPRRERLLLAFAVATALAVGSALADQTVQVGPGRFFSPSTVTVAPGEAVIWNFNELHTSTSDATTGPEVWDSGFLSSGTYSHTFTTPGNYPYYCAVHSFPGGTAMNGVVQVVGAGATPTTTSTPLSTATPTSTSSPTATVTPTLSAPTATVTPTATSPALPSATATAPPGGPTATPPASATSIPALDVRGRLALALLLAAAGVAALLLARRS